MPELGQLLDDLVGPQRGVDPSAVRARVVQRQRHRRTRHMAVALGLVAFVGAGAGALVIGQGEGRTPLDVVGGGGAGVWTSLSPSPVDDRTSASVVWTGTELIVWGGEGESEANVLNTGAAFDPSTHTWRDLPRAPIAGRSGHAAIWTGEEMVVCCGGVDPMGPIAAYSPASNSWRLLQAQSELETIKYPAAVWTGERMIVAGGVAMGSHDAALQYDPAADRWYGTTEHSPVTIERQPDAAWTGREVVVVPREYTDDPPAAFNPATGRWRAFPDPPLSLAIDKPAAVWTGDELLLWGVSRDADPSGAHSPVGARLNVDTGEWRPMADSPLGPVDWWQGTPGSNSATWDTERRRMIVYTGAIGHGRGEETDENAATSVLAYYPDDDSWESLPSVSANYYHPTLVMAGDQLIVASSSFHALKFSD